MNGKTQYSSSGLAPWIWAYRFWARIRQEAGLLANELESDCSSSDLEQWSQAYEANPEDAADVQIATWRKKYPFFDQTFRDDAMQLGEGATKR